MTFKDCLFGGLKLAKNIDLIQINDLDKYLYTNYGIGFDSGSEFSLPDGSASKNVIIFGVDMNSSVNIDNKKKDIFILGEGPTRRLDDSSTLTAEAQYSIDFSRSNRMFCLTLHDNRSNSFLFVNATKIYEFKANDSKIKKYPLCLGNNSGDFSANNTKKTGSYGCMYNFSVDYGSFDIVLSISITIFIWVT